MLLSGKTTLAQAGKEILKALETEIGDSWTKKAGEGVLSRYFGYYCFRLTTIWLKGISMLCLSHMSFSSRFRARKAA